MLQTIDNIENLDDFKTILEQNPGMVIVKLGAEWCKPCKSIEAHVLKWFSQMPDTIQTVLVDVDESFEFYAYLKTKRMINGIPAILMYMKGNLSYTYDDSVAGSNSKDIDMFFQRCLKRQAPAQNLPFALNIPTPPPKSTL